MSEGPLSETVICEFAGRMLSLYRKAKFTRAMQKTATSAASAAPAVRLGLLLSENF